jgi:hypothetical protein
MEKTINIEEIISDIAVHDYIDDDGDNMVVLFKSHLKDSYKKFATQVLELAYENVTNDSIWHGGNGIDAIKKTINQII